jgi:hypothetical protein
MSFFNKRRRRVTIRGQQVTEQDWRGILAIVTALGYFLNATLAMLRFGFIEAIATIGFLLTPEMLVLSWYFKAKEDGK